MTLGMGGRPEREVKRKSLQEASILDGDFKPSPPSRSPLALAPQAQHDATARRSFFSRVLPHDSSRAEPSSAGSRNSPERTTRSGTLKNITLSTGGTMRKFTAHAGGMHLHQDFAKLTNKTTTRLMTLEERMLDLIPPAFHMMTNWKVETYYSKREQRDELTVRECVI